jgi:hypothetical protein
LENGGWPHQFPPQGNYHDYATFNDQGINDCVRVMLEAELHYDRVAYQNSLDRVGRFLLISQLPPPQPGWAQQYNEYLQPAWARSFEPPSVCPQVTVHNLQTLMDLYEQTGEGKYLEAIPDVIRWLKESKLPNGKWGRFLELGTNKPLYYDRERIRVNTLEELSLERRTGYGYEIDIQQRLDAAEFRYRNLMRQKQASTEPNRFQKSHQESASSELVKAVREVVDSQDEQGRWIVKQDKFRQDMEVQQWNGEYRYEDRISSALFNQNIEVLCDFIAMYQSH